MILSDYFYSKKDITWDYAVQCGVKKGVIRLPETEDFDITNFSHWKEIHKNFTDFGIDPIVIEPMPNILHDHIKIGDEKRDECIEKVIKMFPIMEILNIGTICFNFMAHIGWLRTSSDIKERGGAYVTGFDINDFVPDKNEISEYRLWENYEYFIKAVLPYAEKHGIKLALHPDDPPINKLGSVSRILTSYENINNFRETFHDNGEINMADILRLYKKCGVDVPIRVDHVPTMAGETRRDGYAALGRLFAIGYLKGIMDSI